MALNFGTWFKGVTCRELPKRNGRELVFVRGCVFAHRGSFIINISITIVEKD